MVRPFLLIFFGCLLMATHARHLPKYITKCRRSDPKLSACIKEQVEKLRPRLLKGIPELHIPAYDPIEIPELALEQGTDAVRFKANFNNVRTFGARFSKIQDIKIDLENPKLSINLLFPKMRIKTQYDINGKILLLPVRGKGSSDGNFTDVSANVTLLGNFETKNGTQYVILKDRDVDLRIGGSHMYFDNFFNGNRELIETTNKFVNQNWQDIVKELNPVLEETIASLVFTLVKHIFDTYPIDELLPP